MPKSRGIRNSSKQEYLRYLSDLLSQKQSENNPENLLHTKEQLNFIRQITYSNPDQCKYFDYLLMYYAEGYSLRDIARIKSVSHLEVRKRVQDLLKFLRREIKIESTYFYQ